MKCTGSAHENPFNDHCGVCSPFWNWIPTPRPSHALAARKQIIVRVGKRRKQAWEWVGLFHSADVEMEGYKYTVTCEAHGTLTCCDSLKEGRRLVRESYCWCEKCAEVNGYDY